MAVLEAHHGLGVCPLSGWWRVLWKGRCKGPDPFIPGLEGSCLLVGRTLWRLSNRKAVRAINKKPEGSVQEPAALGKGRSWGGGSAERGGPVGHITAQNHSEGETVQESPVTQSQCHHFYKPAVSPSNPSDYSVEAFSRWSCHLTWVHMDTLSSPTLGPSCLRGKLQSDLPHLRCNRCGWNTQNLIHNWHLLSTFSWPSRMRNSSLLDCIYLNFRAATQLLWCLSA